MKAKRLLSFLLVVTMLFGMVSATTPRADTLDQIISRGIGSSTAYLQEQLANATEVTYGYEWYIITLSRAGKTIDAEILEEYTNSARSKVATWQVNEKPTDVERVALALTATGTDVDFAELIYNNARLSEGANELVYALLALDAAKIEIPDTAVWSRSAIISELLTYQASNGGFGLSDTTPDVDMTAFALQALAPYQSDPVVQTATENALAYLKGEISSDCTFADNANSTAQVLLALSVLDVDVTNPENGFGDSEKNLITALETYRNPDGNGYLYDGAVDSMATVQVMQAYDAYRKMEKESISYWDFSTTGAQYDDENSTDDDDDSELQAADPATVFVTIATDGNLAIDKNGKEVAQAQVTVTDRNGDGTLSYDEALYAAHEAYFPGGAEAGYSSYTGQYGLSLAILWGKGSAGTTATAGYYLNDASCRSLADPVKEGDRITAFNYKDTDSWSDVYSFFTEHSVSMTSGSSLTLTLNKSDYFTGITPYANATVVLLGENAPQESWTTDENGQVELTGSNAGTYYAVATIPSGTLVPAVCKLVVTRNSSGGGGSTNTITVSIRVADPAGETYLPKRSYTVAKGTSVFELLQKTGLDIEVSDGMDGYVKAIEGLAEFDDGAKSGWMYCVDGVFPKRSARAYTLSQGDYVEWLYTRDLGDDFGGNDNAGSPSYDDDTTEEPPVLPTKTFDDVSESDWYYDAVMYVSANGLMQGTNTGFAPNDTLTRAMLVTVLYRLDESPKAESKAQFTDIADGLWYTDAIVWATQNEIVQGYGNGEFGVNDPITREQIATILHRYANHKKYDVSVGENTNILSYDDFATISEYAIAPMQYVAGAGLMNGKTESTLNPQDYATRAEIATILMRFCENEAK